MKLFQLFFCVIGLALCVHGAAFSQDILDRSALEKQLGDQKKEIEAIEPILGEGNINEKRMLEIHQTLKDSRSKIQEITNLIQPVHESVKADIADLGPAPEGENATPEPENIQKQRVTLTEELLSLEGLLKQAEALSSKSERLMEKITALRRGQFVDQLFEVQTSPFNAYLWQSAAEAYSTQISYYGALFDGHNLTSFNGLFLSCFIFVSIFIVTTVFSRKHLQKVLNQENPDMDYGTFSYVASSLIPPMLATGVGLLLIYQTLAVSGIATQSNNTFIYKALGLAGLLIFVSLGTFRFLKAGLIRRNMHWMALVAVFLYAADSLFLESGKISGMPVELAVAQSYIVTSVFAIVLGWCSFSIVSRRSDQTRYFFPSQIFIAILGICLFMLAANIFGYAALSRYLFERLVFILLLFAVVMIVRAVIRPYLLKIDRWLSQHEKDRQGKKKERTEKEPERLVFFWLSLTVDLVLFFISLPLIALIFGAAKQDIQIWAAQAFFGFQIGSMTVSIAAIGIAILVFLALLFTTRMIQRVLSQNILPKTKIDEGIRQSIIQILGYVGLIIALMACVSALGFDLTNLALIAGALSVGIGFGLQSIVSNFVSGLILLFERPIKVGDWIITNSGEGIVKRISVRATEIETFDRTSIIVPNSELISSSVKNWTHKDKVGRVVVSVGVSYSSDPHKVKDLLLKCIESHKDALKYPAPSVLFRDFADSALIFDARFFIRNVSDLFSAATEMRYLIWDTFKEANIEISFPQMDLHIRTAEGLQKLPSGNAET
ncbi:MAG: mechanosensitive ion channel family protein [Alphaproteobacteria bacterium]|nr:mechanosensitive ion channel family protein [Alphaproteobacteria bacterium]